MITNSDLEYLALKEAKFDFLETPEWSEELSPINRPMVRIAEQAQTFTALDLYKARAELELAIKKAEQDLTPLVFKTKVNNLKSSLKKALAEQQKLFKQYDDEIKLIEEQLNINEIEKEWQLALHEKLKAEEANKTLWAEISD